MYVSAGDVDGGGGLREKGCRASTRNAATTAGFEAGAAGHAGEDVSWTRVSDTVGKGDDGGWVGWSGTANAASARAWDDATGCLALVCLELR